MAAAIAIVLNQVVAIECLAAVANYMADPGKRQFGNDNIADGSLRSTDLEIGPTYPVPVATPVFEGPGVACWNGKASSIEDGSRESWDGRDNDHKESGRSVHGGNPIEIKRCWKA